MYKLIRCIYVNKVLKQQNSDYKGRKLEIRNNYIQKFRITYHLNLIVDVKKNYHRSNFWNFVQTVKYIKNNPTISSYIFFKNNLQKFTQFLK